MVLNAKITDPKYLCESYEEIAFLDCNQPQTEDIQQFLREEVEIAIEAPKRRSLPELIIYQQNLFKLADKP